MGHLTARHAHLSTSVTTVGAWLTVWESGSSGAVLVGRSFRPLQKLSANHYFYETSFPPLFALFAVGAQGPY